MTEAEKRNLASKICDEALDLEPGTEREAFVRRLCGPDSDLLGYVQEYVLAAPGKSADQRPDRVPQQIGNYKLDQKLGEGSMGIVHRAFDIAIGRFVAVKVLRHQSISTAKEDAEMRLRFTREA